MASKQRYVFDTNVVVSALLFENSVPGQAFSGALAHGEILISQATALELQEVLSRRKFDRYLTADERDRFLVMLLERATLVEITEPIQACRDPKDDKFLELAVNGNATTVITGDEDLLALSPFDEICIVTPAHFVEQLPKEDGTET